MPISGRWFHQAFGFTERNYRETRDEFDITDDVLTSKASGRQFHIGPFEVLSLGTLLRRLAQTEPQNLGIRFRNLRADFYDLYTQADNAGAVFQVESLGNCLQTMEKPERGVTCYAAYALQGSASAIACGAGTVFRNFFVNGTGQGSGHQLNCLSELGEFLRNDAEGFWEMKDGFCIPRPPYKIKEIGERFEKLRIQGHSANLKESVQVGVHWDTEVTDGGHRVCQVFCTSAPVGLSKAVKASEWEPLATLLLECSFNATLAAASLLAAQRKQRVKVFLTELGAGSHGNRKSWIIRALDKVLTLYEHAPLDVTLVHFFTTEKYEVLEANRMPVEMKPRLDIEERVRRRVNSEADISGPAMRRPSTSAATGEEAMARAMSSLSRPSTTSMGRRPSLGLVGAARRPSLGGIRRPSVCSQHMEPVAGSDHAANHAQLQDEQPAMEHAHQILKAFAYFDSNGDGIIDRSEFEQALKTVDPEFFSPGRIGDLLAEADADGDGDVHYGEFVTWLCGIEDSVAAARILGTTDVHSDQGYEFFQQ